MTQRLPSSLRPARGRSQGNSAANPAQIAGAAGAVRRPRLTAAANQVTESFTADSRCRDQAAARGGWSFSTAASRR